MKTSAGKRCCLIFVMVGLRLASSISQLVLPNGEWHLQQLLASDNAVSALEGYVNNIEEICSGLGLGCGTAECIDCSIDYALSFIQEKQEPCHTSTVQHCLTRSLLPSGTRLAAPVNLSGLVISEHARIRIQRQEEMRSRFLLSEESMCTFDAILKCSLNATLVVDLNCDDNDILLGRISNGYKYVCVSGRPELLSDNAAFFDQPRKQFILGDVLSPRLFDEIRSTSNIWLKTDVIVILARHLFEYLPYASSLALLSRIRSSGASFLIATNTVGSVHFNPVERNVISDYTPLNLQKYPFHLGKTKLKWRERSISEGLMTEVWDVERDIPITYPFYHDDLLCSRGVPMQSKLASGPDCEYINKGSSKNWALFVHRAEGKVYSQGGQDGALQYIFQHIGVKSESFVEFGFNGPSYEQDSGANTHLLYSMGWKGLLLDGKNSNPALNLHATWIEPETIVSIFDHHSVPKEVDYVSIDIDSTDVWIFRAIVSSGKYRPRVISVEYNSNYPLEATLCNAGAGYNWKVDRLFGTSLLPLKMVGDEFGYALVDVVPHLDAIFVRTDLLNGSSIPEFETWRPFTRKPHHPPSRRSAEEISKYIADYAEWRRNSGDIDSSKGKIVFDQINSLGILL